ncbi:MAG: Wzz/FepE/Etk N-terminal domain-containing protein [Marinobacterium sp.]|nr:Wzz/FepE/Etk N-terminal domain-containing protein [Marinobacterium sp.]
MMRTRLLRNVAALLWAGWRRRYLIAIPILILPIMAAAVAVLAPKTWQTHTTILFQEAARQNPFLEDLAVATNLKARMDALNALLHSRHILADVAFKSGLITEEMPDTQKAWVIAELSQGLQATLVGDDLIRISYRSENRDNLKEILTLVSVRFVERVLAPQRSSIYKSEVFLASELEQRRSDLEQSEQKLAQYRSEHASELPELHAGNVARLTSLRTLLAEQKTRLEGARAARSSLFSRLSQTNPVVSKIEEEIVEVLARLSVLRARYTDHHSQVQSALRTLSTLRQERSRLLAAKPALQQQTLERLWAIATSSRNSNENGTQTLLVSQLERFQQADDELRGLTEEVQMLEQEISNLSTRVSNYGLHEQRLTELQREVSIRRKIYEDLAERHQLARVTGALGKSEESERVKLIDPPFTPAAPSNLPLPVFVVLGVIAGIALGIGLATLAELLDSSLRRRDTVSQLVDLPVLTRIPPLPPSSSLDQAPSDSQPPDLTR